MMKTIIFLHGGPGFTDYLRPFFEDRFGSTSCIFFDQLQGNSIKMNDLIDQLNDVVATCEGKPILLGHSWGGVLAAEYAKREQEKLSGLVLMSTGLNSTQWTLYNEELESKGMGDIERDELFFTAVEMEAGKKMFEHDSWGEFSPESFEAIFEDYLKSYDLLSELENINLPMLNIYGECDLRFSKNVTTTFSNYNKSIVNLEVKDSGHFPFLLEPNINLIVENIKKHFASQSI